MKKSKATVVKQDNRPSVRAVARTGRFPVISGAALGFLVVDSARLHLLHHAIGAGSGSIAFILCVILFIIFVRGFRRWTRRFSEDES